MKEESMTPEYLAAETIVEQWYKGINDVVSNQSRKELTEDVAAALTKLKSDVERLRTSLAIAEGILARIEPATLDRGFQSRSIETICGDIKNWKRCHSARALEETK